MKNDFFLRRFFNLKNEDKIKNNKKQFIHKSETEKSSDLIVDSYNEEKLTMQDVDKIKTNTSISEFLVNSVSLEVKKAALNKLFKSDNYKVIDELDDYNLDYSKVNNLSKEVVEELSFWLKKEIESKTMDGNDINDEVNINKEELLSKNAQLEISKEENENKS